MLQSLFVDYKSGYFTDIGTKKCTRPDQGDFALESFNHFIEFYCLLVMVLGPIIPQMAPSSCILWLYKAVVSLATTGERREQKIQKEIWKKLLNTKNGEIVKSLPQGMVTVNGIHVFKVRLGKYKREKKPEHSTATCRQKKIGGGLSQTLIPSWIGWGNTINPMQSNRATLGEGDTDWACISFSLRWSNARVQDDWRNNK